MRIAYIARWDVSEESGVLKKMVAQIRCWREAGHDAALFALGSTSGIWQGAAAVPVIPVATGRLGREAAMRRLLQQVHAWRPDLGYLRFSTHFWSLESFLQRVPTVVELNSRDLAEYRLYLPRHKYWYHRATRLRTLRRAQGIIAVSREILAPELGLGKPSTVISNGIDLTAYSPLPPSRGERVHAVFLGSYDADWHGLDKIADLARHLPDWRFSVIGCERTHLRFPSNVATYGNLRRASYEQILSAADVAIGTLALHRKQMQEASPLKVREYLAFGLPCIVGYSDTDFPEPTAFLLQLPNEEANIAGSVDAIRDFGERWRGRRVARESIAHLEANRKEEGRLAFFHQVMRTAEATPRGAEHGRLYSAVLQE